MRLRLSCLVRIWACIVLYGQSGHGLRNRVYLEADKNCGKEETLVPGQHLIVGGKHGGQEILKEHCEITFRLANQNSRDTICIEFEQLDFQGNCFASLSVTDIVGNSPESLYTENQDVKQVGLYTCEWEPPVEVCSVGQSLRIHLDRGYHTLDRELVVFLLEVYTKNPDVSATDSPVEEPSMFGFFGDQPTPVLLLVIIVLCLVITVTATVIVICMRLKSRTSCRQLPLPPEYAHANASVLSQDANMTASQLSSHEYYQLQPLPPITCDNHVSHSTTTPTAPFLPPCQPNCVYQYHRLNKDLTIHAQQRYLHHNEHSQHRFLDHTDHSQHRFLDTNDHGQHRYVDHPDLMNRTVFTSQRSVQGSVKGYNKPVSERSVSGYNTGKPISERSVSGYNTGKPGSERSVPGYSKPVSERSVPGYKKTISERSVSPNDPGYSTEPAVRCYYGYQNPCVLHGYSGLPDNCQVLQGYHSYPGLQYMGLPPQHCGYGSQAGVDDADESDVSEGEGEGHDGISKNRHPVYQDADFTASQKADKVKWAQMGVL